MTDEPPRWARHLGVALLVVGLLLATSAGLSAGQYTPSWFDPDDPLGCATGAGGCGPDGPEAALQGLWWWAGAGVFLAVVGVALVVRTLDGTPRGAPDRRLPAVVHALGAAALVPLLLVALVLPAFLLLLAAGSAHVLVGMLLAGWLLESTVLHLLDGAIGEVGTSSRGRAAAALAASGLAVGVTAAELVRDPVRFDRSLLLGHMAAVALAVLLVRFLAAPGAAGARARGVGAGAAAALAVVALVLVPISDDRAVERGQPVAIAPTPAPTPAPEPSPAPVPPAPTPEPTPEPVVADQPCAQSDLTFRVGGFDAAMGARAAALEATNTGPTSCWLEGVPVVVLLQDGRPLALQVGPGETPEGTPAEAQRVGVAPGGSAVALLTWRSYGGWADLATPQAVTVALDASTTLVAAELEGGGAAPFDIADGGAWGIAPWAPPWS
ncbi:DUF4232 domain-containing protein [uncultured Modestobacter sp.]|uniref:DUF4232 domain-containing protein n=1 Tax=uncultured Modestobacter sp. TaxID=380048 RepID=UPI0026253257|nr:DUF4232 domain-containing protein [uncultured Modestobacter sp.]